MKVVGVPETFQHRIVPGWFEELQHWREDFIQERVGVPDVEIERKQVASEMELWLVV
jgi:hypothetical protein